MSSIFSEQILVQQLPAEHTTRTYIESGIWIGNLADAVAELCRNFADALIELKVKPEQDGYFCAEVVYDEDAMDPREVPSYGRCPRCGFEDPEFLLGYAPGSPVLCPGCGEVLKWDEVLRRVR